VLSIAPKHSVSSVLGYLKGKSAIMIHREMERVKHGFTGKHFWAQGYFASTVGLDEEMIREYVRHQEESDDEGQSGLFPKIAPSRGFPSSHVLWAWFVTGIAAPPVFSLAKPLEETYIPKLLMHPANEIERPHLCWSGAKWKGWLSHVFFL